jgi:hypothetical protein
MITPKGLKSSFEAAEALPRQIFQGGIELR